MPSKPALIIHGGAGNIPAQNVSACRAGVRRALEAGWEVLARGGFALDAIEAAIVILEDDPIFDAGVGSHLNLEGRVQLDAIVMNGRTLKAGAVAAVERVRNPIRLARLILEKSEHMMLVAAGAEKFAADNGLALCAPEELVTAEAREAWQRCVESSHSAAHHVAQGQGTVGAVALDAQGELFAATSTGGTCCKYPGRVGDSPLIGCGCYADVNAGGVSCTGLGEAIMRIVMAKAAVDLLHVRDPLAPAGDHSVAAFEEHTASPRNVSTDAQAAADKVVLQLANRGRGTGGLILLDVHGQPAAAFNTPRMAYGYVEPDGSFRLFP